MASLDGRVRVQGTASGLRLVLRTTTQDVAAAASTADLLARPTGAEPYRGHFERRKVATGLC
ncbi:hypothetical protein N4G70_34950 [Streptomyces sp. ASQP_92]|uniref:hypothetical protein n=1 Tax=Streptomyces sp. ASQP_92 TaxID=2979116 RepID=UPI0021BEE6AC|nr:hypothetical protein [Streptomyces sp. ASQP_92]